VGQVVRTLPEGEQVRGLTLLAGEIYALRRKDANQIEVYDVSTYSFRRCVTVPKCHFFTDMTSCEHYRCVYIADTDDRDDHCIHRLNVQVANIEYKQCAIEDRPCNLSVNGEHNLLVACNVVRMIKVFTTHGEIVREIRLPDNVIYPWHAIGSHTGQYIVCHGASHNDSFHRVCVINVDGSLVVHSHGGKPGSADDQYFRPRHLSVDDFEFVFVSDCNNRRVKLLSPTLCYVREVVSRDQLKWRPYALHFDVQRRRLYVADNDWTDDTNRGRVVVFSA